MTLTENPLQIVASTLAEVKAKAEYRTKCIEEAANLIAELYRDKVITRHQFNTILAALW